MSICLLACLPGSARLSVCPSVCPGASETATISIVTTKEYMRATSYVHGTADSISLASKLFKLATPKSSWLLILSVNHRFPGSLPSKICSEPGRVGSSVEFEAHKSAEGVTSRKALEGKLFPCPLDLFVRARKNHRAAASGGCLRGRRGPSAAA